MAKIPLRVVLDTNILVSAFLFGGKPRDILFEVLSGNTVGITSQILLAELIDVITKKFKIGEADVKLIESQIRDKFIFVFPKRTINILEDDPDNRVLEAAAEGNCDFIITGDKDLLNLKILGGILILKPLEFLDFLAKLQK